ncbi:uncharacterized protein PGTG_21479 [Puccinia graminis f. sp. tritici CRL 75-36-700-3]|uniref:Ceramide glucosyltransferase n=1 Tax=Puccinia graminis f. sp. tritici (strain CRL 75-36-700-3 / race SCCL) TaxID=418459 RepID=H6QRT2_PUCGT|nr:uncharacterized protein PGTG_21479 [Puccinia graminis f. sp. tritici CRL 75-36-700-3]EHS63405.1 hypothetical protein PGTG_21479 [Puccinia graminis f. sp. tritici CRL 75-36-700-3]
MRMIEELIGCSPALLPPPPATPTPKPPPPNNNQHQQPRQQQGDAQLPRLTSYSWISLAWYAIMVLMAVSGSVIAFRKYRQPPPPPPFPISSSPLSQVAPNSNPIRPNSKTQNLLIPSVSILRPLCGLDYGLRENLESAFLQQWPLDRFEIIFCVAHPDDPARKVAQELISKYPAVRARLLIAGEERVGVNPKINNLMEAYRTAEADLLWILDSNARVHPTTLARAVSVLCPPSGPTRSRGRTRIGLVHHVPAAILPKSGGKQNAQRGLGCLLEGCFLNGNHARQYLSLNALGVASCLMGKSNLFYRSDLEQATRRFLARNRGDNRPNNPRFDLDESDEQASLLGSSNNSSNRNQHSSFDALELFGQYLAEDNMIGQTLWDDGIRHAMTIDVVGNVVGPLSVKDYFSRRIRWIRARKYMSIGTTLVEPFTESILLGIVMTLAVDRLDLTNGMSKKVVMMIHEVMYFMLDYLVYRSLLQSPLVLSALQSASAPGPIYTRQPAKASASTGSSSSSTVVPSSASASSSSATYHHPYSEQEEEPSQQQQQEEQHHERDGGEELIQIKLNFFEFLIGWTLRECSALSIWLIAMSSNKVQWRKPGKVLTVLRNARVAESN